MTEKTYHAQQLDHGFRGLRTDAQPVLCPARVELDVLVPSGNELGRPVGEVLGGVGGGEG